MTMTIKFTKGNINPTTKKFPRTLSEAFPEAPEPTFEKTEMNKEDQLVIVVCVLLAVIVFGAILLGVI